MHDNCNNATDKLLLMQCIKYASNANIIKPYLINTILNEDYKGNNNSKIFDDACNAFKPEYTIYQITGSVNIPFTTK